MAISRELFDLGRSVPEVDEEDWGGEVTGQLADLLEGADAILFRVGSFIGVRLQSASSTLAAAATLTPTAVVHKVQGDGGAVVLDTTTAIDDGSKDGQVLILQGAHATNTVTIQDGANVALNGDCELGENECLTLRWDTTVGAWIEVSRSN